MSESLIELEQSGEGDMAAKELEELEERLRKEG